MESHSVEPGAGIATSAAELIWNKAVMNFHLTDSEILLPLNITAIIGSSNIERLKSQLSNFLRRPCVAFVDESLGCVRILSRPEFKGLVSAADNMVLAQTSNRKQFVLNGRPVRSPEKMDKKAEKRPKVPRPPNAFILYRKHYHTILKGRDPNMHNNDISVTVGSQWNNESEEVKSHFRALAAEAKRQHAQKYPNYQYTPRKPCEKKRRNSRRATETSDLDAFTEDEEEISLQTPCESPVNPSPSTEVSGQDQDEFTEQTMEELMSFVAVPSPPPEAYSFSDFDATEYNSWVNNANTAQRMAAVIQYNLRAQAQAHVQARAQKCNVTTF
ncbi:hypothetical protein TMatcc_009665 [Talaromyces marneffei ATCC 18224]|uniref:Mating type protein MAT1-2-1 n=1 Tax=Talaromyces marneffei (strain ATCC 18224 / CBS 334.59 / QM 7333) TaxID=441960 RepID=B6QT96_TALMQ|nr:uncharacterized protein EYB26_008907 [Talaromyces marneffei]EEA19532.1 mating type protein MAT1-2-1 [Talaromyces marneffei ATCC 18224]KAE8547846.1 hypothetical protein EYB25_009639 [Talaromyces marneffei]QGA21197.1 hypothetical protein EYB26_008907 [Talaromyces marneffei]